MLLLWLACEQSGMSESFGARLRQRREQQQISLSTIAEQTKIKQSLLEALERGDVSHWPSGIFRRAFIRAYAHAIGLEPDVVVREFLEIYPDPAEVVEPMPAIASTLDGSAGGAPIRLRYLVASAVGSLSRRRARSTPEPIAPAPSRSVQRAAVQPVADVRLEEAAPVVEVVQQVVAPPPERQPEPIVRLEVQAPAPAPDPIDLPAIAELCTQLGRVSNATELPGLLQEAARILDASGLVVWIWDPVPAELQPALAHGYSDRVLAQLPGLPRDAHNATAAAFRAAQVCVVPGDEAIHGALVLPLLTPTGCTGVLALEMQKRNEERESVRAAGMIIAAQFAALIGAATGAEGSDRVRSSA
jgi:transcriptional regulator with XRE-family HTH domain